MPRAQQTEMAALTLLALARIRPEDDWTAAEPVSLTITKGIMDWVAGAYGRQYAPNTRETFRRQVLHQFVQAALAAYNPDDPNLPTNSPRAHYRLTEDAARVLRSFGTGAFAGELENFRGNAPAVAAAVGRRVTVELRAGQVVSLSPGTHNELEEKILTLFRGKFSPHSRVLYVGDTADKMAFLDREVIAELALTIDEHGKLPDVVIFDDDKRCLLLIEAVTSHGPMTPKRVEELRTLFGGLPSVYVSAFPDFSTFRKYLPELAWDTEAWIAEEPEHMIHFNGDRFIAPRR